MVREDLVVALNNAVERQQSLQEAIQTLISAGYNSKEVSEAAQHVNIGFLSLQNPDSKNEEIYQEQNPELLNTIQKNEGNNLNDVNEKAQTNLLEKQYQGRDNTKSGFKSLPKMHVPARKPEEHTKIKLLLIFLVVLLLFLIIGLFALNLGWGDKILKSLFD